jgi:hypothetical protein
MQIEKLGSEFWTSNLLLSSLSCRIPSLVDERLNESWLGDRGDRHAAAWFALAALLAPASLHCLAAVLL